MAGGPIRGIRRLTKREAGHLPIVQRGRGEKYTDAEHGLINISKALVEEAQFELDKPTGKRDYTKLIAIGRQFREWVTDMERREEAERQAAEANGRGGGEATEAGGADPARVLGPFFGGGGADGGGA